MLPPNTGTRALCDADVPSAIHTLPPPCTYRTSALSRPDGTEIKSESTTNADSTAEPSAERKYSGERESPASETNSAWRGSVRSTAKMLTSSAGKVSAESMRTSHFVKPYGTSSDWNSAVARPFAGTFTVLVAAVFPFSTSETVRVAAGVPNPAITACTRAFFGSQTCPGALTLSTVQLGTASFTTGCSSSVTFAGS